MNKERAILVLWLLLNAASLYAQSAKNRENDFETIIDEYFREELDENPERYDEIVSSFENPKSLNNISRQDLEELNILSLYQINNFLEYRKKYGPLLSVYELQAVDGLSFTDIRKLLVFGYLDENPFYEAKSKDWKHQLILRVNRILQSKEGFERADSLDSHFIGDPNQYLVRYKFTKGNNLEGGFTAEKDPGEPMGADWSAHKYFFDFSSGYLSLQHQGIVKQLVIGDYNFNGGQGLVFGSPFIFGPGSNAIPKGYAGARLRPSQSAYEFKNYSGLGISLNKGKLSSTFLVSKTKKDATIHIDESGNPYFKAFNTSGYHRNLNEAGRRRTVTEKTMGMNVDYRTLNNILNVGINACYTKYSLPQRHGNTAKEVYDFSGKRNIVYSIYGNLQLKNAMLLSELAHSKGGGSGWLSGLIYQFTPDNNLAILYRNYQPNFYTAKGNAFGQKTENKNERGIYIGLKIKPIKNVVINSYIDNYSSPWISTKADRPSYSREWLVRVDYSSYRFFQITFIRRSIVEDENTDSSPSNFTTIDDFSYQKNRITLVFKLSNKLRWKNRVQWSSTKKDAVKGKGFLMSTGFNYTSEKVSFGGAFNIFDTDDYENRQYAYIHGLPYSFSIGNFQNEGSNINCVANFHLTEFLLLSGSFVQTIYYNKDEIGSGSDKITGNKKTQVGIQVTANF